jgi:GNAT superfamily N-acetyltransferase
MRLAVAHHGVNGKLSVPLWLELAGVGWWRTQAEAAQLDALKRESARLAPPGLGKLLGWRRGDEEPVRQTPRPARDLELRETARGPEPFEGPRTQSAGAVWLLAFLQGESGKGGEWHALLVRLLAGEPADAALAATFPGKFGTPEERELWWQTGWHHLRRLNVLPVLDAAESRALLVDAARFVHAREDGTDAVSPLRAVLEHAREPVIEAELARRAAELNRVAAALHPFYRNAGLSLIAALETRATAVAKRDAVCAGFERDWRDAIELEAATKAALDRLERERTLSSIK